MRRSSRPLEQARVVQLGLVGEDVRVRVRGHRQVALTYEFPDPGPGDAAQVLERDAPVTEVVGRESRDAGGGAGACDRGAEAVAAEACEDAPLGRTIVAGYEFEH